MRFYTPVMCSITLASLLFPLLIAPAPAQVPVTVQIDAAANRRPINPNIYGLAYATTAQLLDLNVSLNRLGGNNTTRYNWLLNADNKGNDWYFQSIGDSSATPSKRADDFFFNAKQGGAEPMLTVPLIDWIAKLGSNRNKLASFSIKKYGAQTGSDWQWFPDAGNGVSSATGKSITGNDPNDANTPNNSTIQQQWAQHLVDKWGSAANGGLKYYILDNEPSIWFGTHRDVQPTGLRMAALRDKIVDYGTKIKAVDPNARLVGPEEWGWTGYFYSGYDTQYGNTHGWGGSLPDRTLNGGKDYLPWLLDQMRQHEQTTGQRLLDVFTVHYYPQGGEFSNDVSTAMQQRRNRSTRSLWDPAYKDETWINDKVQLIPRLKEWVNTYYPNTPIGLTEYNWGAESHINGATTQADILGIFGREGLDMAARWTTPGTNSLTYNAIKMYRNYDGAKSTFGETSVQATVPNPDELSAFAALRAQDESLTVMVVNKSLSNAPPVTLLLANYGPQGRAEQWQMTKDGMARKADIILRGGVLRATVPAQSVTLFVITERRRR